tara:strand:- start:1865 stop:2038 length:174 start_codon:yes stop_codon:yes gene_type:complete
MLNKYIARWEKIASELELIILTTKYPSVKCVAKARLRAIEEMLADLAEDMDAEAAPE